MTLDAETQERLGLKIESPTAAQWQPEAKGYGMVISPSMLVAASADTGVSRAASVASDQEYERQKTLAAQGNSSARALETAKAASTRDQAVFEAAISKFIADWGEELSLGGGEKILSQVVLGKASLVRIDLPPGERLASPPTSARIVSLADDGQPVSGSLCGATQGVNPQTQCRSYFFLVKPPLLTPGSAVTGFLKVPGEPISGVTVPADAVVRHDGKGWVYVQTATNQFARTEIPLDRLTGSGWFVSGDLSATNRIVTSGGQTVLSTELGGAKN